jgi:putative toxin-antitoxin system antitoxin component (TIGR02293 family)
MTACSPNHGGLSNCWRVANDCAKSTSQYSVARVTTRARQVFAGQPAYAAPWLREPKSSLGYRTPLQWLATESGALVVEEQLAGIEHGMFG